MGSGGNEVPFNGGKIQSLYDEYIAAYRRKPYEMFNNLLTGEHQMAIDNERVRLIVLAEERGDLVIFEDGYTYYCPTGGGGLTAHNLRVIADELDRRNAPMDELYKRSVENDRRKTKERSGDS